MTNDITTIDNKPLDDFQNKIIDKLRKDIGELLPDAVVNGLVKKAVHEHFFKEREIEVKDGYYSTKKVKTPSWFLEEVIKVAEPLMIKKVEEYVKSNEELIKSEIDKVLTQEKLLLLAVNAIGNNTNNALSNMLQNIIYTQQR